MDREAGDEGVALVYHWYTEGRSRLSAGNARAAVEVLELAVEREPEKASLRETLGRAYLASARVGRAREEFERAVEMDPSDPYAHYGVGRCFEREGRLPEAAKHYKVACALSPRRRYVDALARIQRRLQGDSP